MKKYFFVSLLLVILLFSCKNSFNNQANVKVSFDLSELKEILSPYIQKQKTTSEIDYSKATLEISCNSESYNNSKTINIT